MKALKKSMLILSVMTVIGGLGFSATAKNTRKRVVKKPVVKKVVTESYTCGADTIKVSYPTSSSARIVDASGRIYNLKSAVAASGARYTSKGGDIEFFTSGDNVLFTGPSGIETSCVKK